MKTKIVWTNKALAELNLIYEYYSENLSEQVAKNLVKDIFDTSQIETFPLSGTIEPNLKGLKYEFRYIVIGKYKLIYFFDNNTIVVSDVFDCRKDPKQMNKRI